MLSEAGGTQPAKPAVRPRALSFEEQKRAQSRSSRQGRYPEAPTTFRGFWELGYRQRLLPIVPPNAEISERSSLAKRVGTSQDGRGKTPGIRGHTGSWFGFDWVEHEADEEDLKRWARMGAGIGIQTGSGLVGIDADTLDPNLANIIAEKISKFFVRLPSRIGRAPKKLFLARVSEPMRYSRVEFGELNEKGKPKERIELLTEGRQFVACGTHPFTGKPYLWPDGLPSFDELPVYSPGFFQDFMEELRRELPNAAPIVTEGSTASVDQASLRGELEKSVVRFR